MNSKKHLSERDICSKFITPALQDSGWDIRRQIREEVSFTAGRIIVKGKLAARGKKKSERSMSAVVQGVVGKAEQIKNFAS